MITPTYMQYGCNPLINNARTYQYWLWACEQGMLGGECTFSIEDCSCASDVECDPGPFVDPITDNVCWYDSTAPESAEFLGAYIISLRGSRDSTFSREVVDSVGVGSVLQQPRLRGRAFQFEVMLIATSCAGMQYGIEYMRRTLEDSSTCGQTGCISCQGREMTLRVFCPKGGDSDNGLRQWLSVGLVDGMQEVEEGINPRCCCNLRRFTFTMQSESPYAFNDEELVCEIEASTSLDGYCNFDFDASLCDNCIRIECDGDCDNCELDPLCQCEFIFECPPVISDDCETCEPWRIVRACCCIEDLPNAHDTAFTIEIDGGRAAAFTDLYDLKGLRNVRVRFWDKPAWIPCPTTDEELEEFTTNRAPCWDIRVPYIPFEGTVRLNGKLDRSEVICNNKCKPYDRLIATGDADSLYPLVSSCAGMLLCVEFDADKTPMTGNPDTITPAAVRIYRAKRWRS